MVLVLGPVFPLPVYCVLFRHYLKLPEVSVEGEFFFFFNLQYLNCLSHLYTGGIHYRIIQNSFPSECQRIASLP